MNTDDTLTKCERCDGSGFGIAEDYIDPPTYWELVNCDPRPCTRCWGAGKYDPYEYDRY